MRDGFVGVSATGSAREGIKRLWKAYFADPSQWWDCREFKRNPKAPDFQHKISKEKLWLDGSRNPSWVIPMLEKRKQDCLALGLPTTVLEEGTEKKKTAHQECVSPTSATFSKESKLKTAHPSKKLSMNASSVASSHAEMLEKHSKRMKKSSIVGRVCDWHSLSLEDAIEGLEKGLFSEPSV
eukprot:c24275_g2_i1 orf=1-543(-)